jgi:hypothetical protein
LAERQEEKRNLHKIYVFSLKKTFIKLKGLLAHKPKLKQEQTNYFEIGSSGIRQKYFGCS